MEKLEIELDKENSTSQVEFYSIKRNGQHLPLLIALSENEPLHVCFLPEYWPKYEPKLLKWHTVKVLQGSMGNRDRPVALLKNCLKAPESLGAI